MIVNLKIDTNKEKKFSFVINRPTYERMINSNETKLKIHRIEFREIPDRRIFSLYFYKGSRSTFINRHTCQVSSVPAIGTPGRRR